jgi:hypothetical protein
VGKATHTRIKERAQTRTLANNLSSKFTHRVLDSEGAQIAITTNQMRWNGVLVLRDDQRLLGILLHAPRGPFYSPKAARSRWKQSRKAILAFYRVAHRTGTIHSAVQIAFLKWRRTLSGAHRTVRCPHPTVGSATRHARIARPTVGAPDRWLTGQSGAPLDSPVNFSRTLLTVSRERRLRRRRLTRQSGAPPDSPVIYSRTLPSRPESRLFTWTGPGTSDTVRCTTGQSGAPRPSSLWLNTANLSSKRFLLFLALRHNTLVFKTMY